MNKNNSRRKGIQVPQRREVMRSVRGGILWLKRFSNLSQIRPLYFRPCQYQYLFKSFNLHSPMHVVYQLPRISSIAPPAPECISIALCDELVEQGWRVVTCYGYASQRGAGEEMQSSSSNSCAEGGEPSRDVDATWSSAVRLMDPWSGFL